VRGYLQRPRDAGYGRRAVLVLQKHLPVHRLHEVPVVPAGREMAAQCLYRDVVCQGVCGVLRRVQERFIKMQRILAAAKYHAGVERRFQDAQGLRRGVREGNAGYRQVHARGLAQGMYDETHEVFRQVLGIAAVGRQQIHLETRQAAGTCKPGFYRRVHILVVSQQRTECITHSGRRHECQYQQRSGFEMVTLTQLQAEVRSSQFPGGVREEATDIRYWQRRIQFVAHAVRQATGSKQRQRIDLPVQQIVTHVGDETG